MKRFIKNMTVILLIAIISYSYNTWNIFAASSVSEHEIPGQGFVNPAPTDDSGSDSDVDGSIPGSEPGTGDNNDIDIYSIILLSCVTLFIILASVRRDRNKFLTYK